MRRLMIFLLAVIGPLFCFNASTFAATATLLGTDTTTQGSWLGIYGTVGYYIPDSISKTPTDGSTFSPGAASLWTWGTNVSSASALKTGASTNIASCWYNNAGTLSFDVVIPSGQSQIVALYLLDYDRKGRAESVTVTDASDTLLTGPTVVSGTNFANGEYLTYTVTGEVHFDITLISGPNAVASGIFFGETGAPIAAGAYFNYSSTIVSVAAGGTSMTPIATLTLPAGTYLLHARVQINNTLGTPVSEPGECEFSQLSATGIPSLLHVWFAPAGGIIEVTLDAPYTTSASSVISVGCVVVVGGSAQSVFGATISAVTLPSIITTNQ